MTEDQIRKILDEHKSGGLSLDDALARLRALPFENLGFANVDHHRSLRQGFPEAVFSGSKNGLRKSLPQASVVIHVGESKVFKRQISQAFQNPIVRKDSGPVIVENPANFFLC